MSPGKYQDTFIIKKPTIIEGDNYNTKIIINNQIIIENNLILKNVNVIILPLIYRNVNNIFYINIETNYKNFDEKSYLTNTILDNIVKFSNVNFIIQNVNQSNIFCIENGKLEFDDVKINYKQLNKTNNKIVFLSKLNSFISVVNSDLNFEIADTDLIIFNCNMSKLNITNTSVKKYLKENSFFEEDKNFIINNYYSEIDIVSSKFINSTINGSIINFIDDTEFIKDLKIFNSEIKDNKMIVELNSENYLEMLLLLKLECIIINSKKYYFKNYKLYENQIHIILNNTNFKNNIIKNPRIQYLYKCYILNSFLNETSKFDNYKFKNVLPENYGLICINTVINNYNNELCNLELNDNSEIVGVKFDISGTLTSSNNIKTNYYIGNGKDIENINFKKCKEGIKSGFRIQDKEKNKGNIGINSIDMTFLSPEKNINIYKEEYGVMGDNSFGIGIDNILIGNNNFIAGSNNKIISNNCFVYGNNLNLDENGVFMIGKHNIGLKTNVNKLFVIGNGDEENKSDGLVFFENGDLKIQGKFNCYQFQVDNLNIENNNINNVDNISINENLFCDGDLILEGNISGKKITSNKNVNLSILNNNGIIETKIELNLENLKRPKIDGGIIGNDKISYLCNLDENKNGVLYKMIIICIEEPNFNDIRFIESENDELNIYSKNFNFTDLVCNQNWKKGLYKEIDCYNFDLEDKYIYISRMDNFTKYNKKSINQQKLFTSGKFLIKLLGGNKF